MREATTTATATHRSPLRAVCASGLAGVLCAAGLLLVATGTAARAGPPMATSPRLLDTSAATGEIETPTSTVTTPTETDATPHHGETAASQATASTAALPRSIPVALDIPSIGVHTSLIQLGLQPDGTVAVPPLTKHAAAGWYRYLSSPGEPGPSVILGHVDSAKHGPAVFYRLGELHSGATLSVRRRDGRVAEFTVRKVAAYPKSAFPSAAVYGPVQGSQLRLVTCGGSFDRSQHQYRDNIVVFAELTGP